MNIFVCIKQVPSTNKVQVDEKTGVLKRDGVMSKMNPYDLFALETALRTALLEESPQEVADRLLTLAALSRGGRADDRSAVVIRLARSGG